MSARWRWVVVAAAVVVSTFAARPDVVTLAGAPVEARLDLPTSYVLLSPAARLFDALALLSLSQHAALWSTVVLCWVAWWRVRRVSVRRAMLRLAAVAAVTFVVYALATLPPRPMARLIVDDPEVVRVDFHAHTNASPDVPRWFGVAERRAWHRAGGFDVAYVTDHRSWRGVRAALASNPPRAGDGLVLLSALEGYVGDLNTIFLGVMPADSARVVRQHLAAATLASGRAPVAIATLPGPLLGTVSAAARDRPPFVRAVEISDGAPRGLSHADRDGAAIRARAESLGIGRVAGSNHHGWGSTVVAWNLVRVAGWRALAPDTLAVRLEERVRRGAVTVVARRRPVGATWFALGATAPALVWQTLTTLHLAERLDWLAWIVAAAVVRGRVRGRDRRTSPQYQSQLN